MIEEGALDCTRAEELLPWLMNGSLEPGASAELRRHLAGCAACRQAFEETGLAARIFGQHVPPQLLVSYAFGEPLAQEEREHIDTHLPECAECAGELVLVRASREALSAPGPSELAAPAPRSPPSTWWRAAALAAGVTALLLGGAAVWSLLRAGGLERRLADERARRTAAESTAVRLGDERGAADRAAEEAQAAERALEERVAALEAPQLNAPVFDLMPRDLVLRGPGAEAATVEMPAGAAWVTLILAPPAPPVQGPLEVEVVALGGTGERRVWEASGLRRQALGDYTLTLPATLLPEGECELRLAVGRQGARRAVAAYRFVVRRAG